MLEDTGASFKLLSNVVDSIEYLLALPTIHVLPSTKLVLTNFRPLSFKSQAGLEKKNNHALGARAPSLSTDY